ncbi:P27 family phage terminase small subunit, partial [uncultured Gimesia sp.]|uniref:P27 family phage terminase small subunit n=1 Tax=uncultured Gimesia sp. TaxID=1678688 RepID=UPI00262365D6
ETVKEEGSYITQVNKSGGEYTTEHPAVKARSRYWKEVESMARQFGLTPSARTGLNVKNPEGREMSALDQILRGGRN